MFVCHFRQGDEQEQEQEPEEELEEQKATPTLTVAERLKEIKDQLVEVMSGLSSTTEDTSNQQHLVNWPTKVTESESEPTDLPKAYKWIGNRVGSKVMCRPGEIGGRSETVLRCATVHIPSNRFDIIDIGREERRRKRKRNEQITFIRLTNKMSQFLEAIKPRGRLIYRVLFHNWV